MMITAAAGADAAPAFVALAGLLSLMLLFVTCRSFGHGNLALIVYMLIGASLRRRQASGLLTALATEDST